MRIGDAGVARNDLPVGFQDVNGQVVINEAKRVGDLLERNSVVHVLSDLADKDIDGLLVLVSRRCDVILNIEHFRPLLGDFVTVAVNPETRYVSRNLVNLRHIPL